MTRVHLPSSVCTIVVLILVAVPASAGEVNLSWNPSANTDGYRVHRGTESGNYTATDEAGNGTSTTVANLVDCVTWYFAVTAYNAAGESGYSTEVASFPRAMVSTAVPSNVERGAQTDVTISGLNFRPGDVVTVSNPGVQVDSVAVNGCNQMVVTFVVDSGAATGSADLTITHPSGVAVTATDLLVIEDGLAVPQAPTGVQVS
jgi:hypothetical protein